MLSTGTVIRILSFQLEGLRLIPFSVLMINFQFSNSVMICSKRFSSPCRVSCLSFPSTKSISKKLEMASLKVQINDSDNLFFTAINSVSQTKMKIALNNGNIRSTYFSSFKTANLPLFHPWTSKYSCFDPFSVSTKWGQT